MKNSEVLEAQFARFANFVNNTDVEKPIFARTTALRDGLGWSEDKIQENEAALKAEQGGPAEEEGEEGGLGGDLGDLGGGEGEGGLEI
jgi:hypothetical protein